ncbi:MAG: PAS domain S-box protein [Sphingobacteriia bacterium]|nr:PAS domain S-box protein [Sphingobacteriia bacterium]
MSQVNKRYNNKSDENMHHDEAITGVPLTCCTGRMIHKLSVSLEYPPPQQCDNCPLTSEESIKLSHECILSIAHDLVCYFDRSGRLLKISDDWTTLLDYTLEESYGKQFTDFVIEEDQLSTLDVIKKTSYEIPTKNFINRLIDNKNGVHWFEWNFVAAENNKIIFGIAREISLYKQIEHEFQLKANTLNERIKELKCINEVTKLLHNYTLSTDVIITKILFELKRAYQFPEATHVEIIIDDKHYFSEDYKLARLEQSSSINVEDTPRGVIRVGINPEEIKEISIGLKEQLSVSENRNESEIYFLDEEKVLLDSLVDLLAVYLQKLEHNKQTHLLASIVENSADAIVSIDFTGKIMFWNKGAEKLYGLASSEAIGSNIVQFYPNRNGKDLEFFIRECSQGRSIKGYESERIKANGEKIFISLSVSPLVNEQGNIDHFLALVRDITAQKTHEQILTKEAEKAEEMLRMSREMIELKERAEESAKLKSSLLLNMGHELRTPLNGILGFTSLLREKVANDDGMSDMVEFINISGRRLLVTLTSILDLSQLEADSLHFSPVETNLATLLDSTINEFAENLKHKGLRLSSRIEDCGVLLVDKKLISAIFYHIIDNAIKFTEEGQIWVTLKKEIRGGRSVITFCVKDTGVGISDDIMKYIYEPFRQGSEGLGRSHEGYGLGLTLCKSFLNLMEATIEVESEVNIGSTFTVYIDITNANEAALRSYKPKFSIKNKSTAIVNEPIKKVLPVRSQEITPKIKTFTNTNSNLRPRVMVVEDNDVNASLAELILRNDYIVEVAQNATVAIKLATINHYDLILMDINLGAGMDGIVASKEIWKIEGNEHLPIIAVTGYTSNYEKQLILSNGFSAFMAKPYKTEKLLELVHEVLQIIS